MIFAITVFMAINIAIHKTFSIYDSVKKLFVATISIQCFNIIQECTDKKITS